MKPLIGYQLPLRPEALCAGRETLSGSRHDHPMITQRKSSSEILAFLKVQQEAQSDESIH